MYWGQGSKDNSPLEEQYIILMAGYSIGVIETRIQCKDIF